MQSVIADVASECHVSIVLLRWNAEKNL